MKSFLVVCANEEKIKEWVTDTLTKYSVDRFDITVLGQDTKKSTTGIDQVRLIQKNISLKPIAGTVKAVILYNAQFLTIEAQNALLKTLEEPPSDTIIILASNKKEALLPTILSRCTIIDLGFKIQQLAVDEANEFKLLIQSIQNWETGERLKKAEIFAKDKQESIVFLEKIIISTREMLLSQIKEENNNDYLITQLLSYLVAFQKSYQTLSTTNVNPRFTLETMFLSL